MRDRNSFPWTDAQIALLKQLWAEGLSASVCAARLGGGLTRSGVCGKVHRLGLAQRAVTSRCASSRRQARQEGRRSNNGFTFGASPPARRKKARGGVASSALTSPPVATADGLELDLSEIADLAPDICDPAYADCIDPLKSRIGECRFPIGDPTRYCGRKTCGRGHGSYCSPHAARCFRGAGSYSEDDPRREAARRRLMARFGITPREPEEQHHG